MRATARPHLRHAVCGIRGSSCLPAEETVRAGALQRLQQPSHSIDSMSSHLRVVGCSTIPSFGRMGRALYSAFGPIVTRAPGPLATMEGAPPGLDSRRTAILWRNHVVYEPPAVIASFEAQDLLGQAVGNGSTCPLQGLASGPRH